MARQQFRTTSEALFADYLADRRQWEYEAQVGETKPDFLVDKRVACDVTAFEADHLPPRAGVADPVKPIRNKIHDKWKQGQGAAAQGHPFVLVLHQVGLRTDLTVLTVSAACFGDLAVPISRDSGDGMVDATGGLIFLGGGKTEPKGNAGLSAIAILRSFNPTLHVRQREWARARTDADPLTSREQHLARGYELDRRLIAEGRFDPEATAPRLLLVHTRRPEIPLPVGFLGGGYDEEWAIDKASDELRRVHAGNLFDHVPPDGETL